MNKELKITTVDYNTFTNYEFTPPATFYVMDSLQNYHFIHTSDRKVAQDWINSYFGAGRYTVMCSKIQKTKCRSESGNFSVVASATRARPSSKPPK